MEVCRAYLCGGGEKMKLFSKGERIVHRHEKFVELFGFSFSHTSFKYPDNEKAVKK